MIQEESGTSWKEMYQVFNMGHRFEIYTDEETAGALIDLAAKFRIEARIVGRCDAYSQKKLTIKGEQGVYTY